MSPAPDHRYRIPVLIRQSERLAALSESVFSRLRDHEELSAVDAKFGPQYSGSFSSLCCDARLSDLRKSRKSSFVLALCLILASCGLSGCGAKDPPQPLAASSTTTPREEDSTSPAGDSGEPTEEQHHENRTARAESAAATLPKISSDVWFDDPLAELQVAASQAKSKSPGSDVAATESAPSVDRVPVAQPASPASSPASPDKSWNSLISAEVIQDETKRIRLRLADGMRSVVKYNAHYKEIQVDASVLAALAEIVISFPDSVTWKGRAKHVRDAAAQLAERAKALGSKPFEESKKAFQQLDQLLDGNIPSDLPESAAELPFSEVARRSRLMTRLQRTDDWLKTTISSGAALKKEADKAAHEAALMATLAKVIASPGYGSVDEPEYQELAKDLMQAYLEVQSAAQGKDLEALQTARSRAEKSCTKCHLAYRFDDGN